MKTHTCMCVRGCGATVWCIKPPCRWVWEVRREKQRECRCCVAAAAFVVPAGVGRPASLLSCSKCVPSCVIINNSQDTDVCCRGVRRRNFLVYCLCYYDRSSILGSNTVGTDCSKLWNLKSMVLLLFRRFQIWAILSLATTTFGFSLV
jgi:hypothetical protein